MFLRLGSFTDSGLVKEEHFQALFRTVARYSISYGWSKMGHARRPPFAGALGSTADNALSCLSPRRGKQICNVRPAHRTRLITTCRCRSANHPRTRPRRINSPVADKREIRRRSSGRRDLERRRGASFARPSPRVRIEYLKSAHHQDDDCSRSNPRHKAHDRGVPIDRLRRARLQIARIHRRTIMRRILAAQKQLREAT